MLLAGAVSALALAAPGVASAAIEVRIGSNQVALTAPFTADPTSVAVTRGGDPLASAVTPLVESPDAVDRTFEVNVNGVDDGPPAINDCFAGITPDISPGDVVTARDKDGNIVEQTTVRDIAYTATVQCPHQYAAEPCDAPPGRSPQPERAASSSTV